ncbi:MAG: MraZ N-terminal domain-containing protein [Dermatophilaceae bacterium]
MEARIDAGGRLSVPKALRDALGLAPGSIVDISAYGRALQVVPGGRTATLHTEPGGRLVAVGDSPVTDELTFALIDAGRR